MQTNTKPTYSPWSEVAPTGRMLRPQAVAQRLALSRSQIYQMISEGRLPPFIKLSNRASAMPEAWLDAFVQERARLSLTMGEMK